MRRARATPACVECGLSHAFPVPSLLQRMLRAAVRRWVHRRQVCFRECSNGSHSSVGAAVECKHGITQPQIAGTALPEPCPSLNPDKALLP